jgi:excisionase family DNA binding protein
VTLRLALEPDQVARRIPGEAVTVAVAARILGCDPSTVRKLLRRRRLAGHRVGSGGDPGGVRVDLESIEAYKARHAIGAALEADDGAMGGAGDRRRPARRRGVNPAHDEALAQLRAWGVRV